VYHNCLSGEGKKGGGGCNQSCNGGSGWACDKGEKEVSGERVARGGSVKGSVMKTSKDVSKQLGQRL